jgi:hypothetical protein
MVRTSCRSGASNGKGGFWGGGAAAAKAACGARHPPIKSHPNGADNVLGANAISDGRDDDFHLQSLFGGFHGGALAPIVAEAIARWWSSGRGALPLGSLGRFNVQIADLPGSYLGDASTNTIWLDNDAAGRERPTLVQWRVCGRQEPPVGPARSGRQPPTGSDTAMHMVTSTRRMPRCD